MSFQMEIIRLPVRLTWTVSPKVRIVVVQSETLFVPITITNVGQNAPENDLRCLFRFWISYVLCGNVACMAE